MINAQGRYNLNPIELKCHRCDDILTAGELRTHFLKPRLNQSKPTCYFCSQEILKEIKERYQDEKNEEFSEKIREQHDRWGAPRSF